jgi:thioredoxin reductase/SAM-dependent methyltransferase
LPIWLVTTHREDRRDNLDATGCQEAGVRYDVVVVGGGVAGLTGAMVLARSRRSVLVIDQGQPRNAPAEGVHNYLGREGTPPAELLAIGRAEASSYGAQIWTGEAVSATTVDGGFTVTLADGATVQARRLLVTSGLIDELPELPGLAQRWGRDVLHCPYCHGFEVRDRRIGVLADGARAVEQAQLWRQLSPQVLLLNLAGPLSLGDADRERLAARTITVVDEPVIGLEVVDDALAGVRLASGEVIDIDVLAVSSQMVARSAILESLGLTPVDVELGGTVIGHQIPADAGGATAVPGVWIAGNVADVRASVLTASAAGMTAAAMINADLVADDTAAAVESYRHQRATLFEQEAWEERYASKPSIWSGNPNAQLIAETANLPPGRALDVGCGEGADAVWLARRGWQVVGVDISPTALARAAAHADAAGADVAARITWHHTDLRHDATPGGEYDLVSAHFMQLPQPERGDLFARLAAAVAPGGTLLIVGHHPRDLRASNHRMHFPELMYTAEEVAADLDAQVWEILVAASRPRSVTGHDGQPTTYHDAVLVARRRA